MSVGGVEVAFPLVEEYLYLGSVQVEKRINGPDIKRKAAAMATVRGKIRKDVLANQRIPKSVRTQLGYALVMSQGSHCRMTWTALSDVDLRSFMRQYVNLHRDIEGFARRDDDKQVTDAFVLQTAQALTPGMVLATERIALFQRLLKFFVPKKSASLPYPVAGYPIPFPYTRYPMRLWM